MWTEEGKVTPITRIQAGPVVVTQIKTKDSDGYEAIQVGYDDSKKKLSKALAGHFKDLGKFRFVREYRKDGVSSEYTLGQSIDVSSFQAGDRLRITGLEKGRGFQGVVKRHGFHGGPKTHGQKNRLRAPGSLGATAPQRVLKGKKMAGRMGNETVTLRNVKVMEVIPETNTLVIKGPIPGTKKQIVIIQKM